MALIKCPECGKEISNEAKACPHCGKPMPKTKSKPLYKYGLFWIIMGLLLFFTAMIVAFVVNYNKGVQEFRQSDAYKELQEIIDESERISSRAESRLEELNGAQSQLDRYTTAHIFRGVRFSAQIIGNLLIFTTRCSIIIIEIYRWRVYGNLV